MNDKWQQYEEKRKALNKKFKKQYLKVLLIFLAYNIVADILIFAVLKTFIGGPFAIVAFLVSTGLSFFFALKSFTDLKNIKNQQEIQLMQDAPVGRIRY